MISTNQIAYFKRNAICFKTMTVVLLLRFRVTLGMWSTQIITQNVKASEIPLVA